jgi:hypothetical protein
VIGAEAHDTLGLAHAVWQRQRAANHLIRLLGVDAQVDDQLDTLVKLDRLERLDDVHRLIDRQSLLRALLDVFLVALGTYDFGVLGVAWHIRS